MTTRETGGLLCVRHRACHGNTRDPAAETAGRGLHPWLGPRQAAGVRGGMRCVPHQVPRPSDCCPGSGPGVLPDAPVLAGRIRAPRSWGREPGPRGSGFSCSARSECSGRECSRPLSALLRVLPWAMGVKVSVRWGRAPGAPWAHPLGPPAPRQPCPPEGLLFLLLL